MQKIYLRYRNEWWFRLAIFILADVLTILIANVLNKLVEIKLIRDIHNILLIKIPLWYLATLLFGWVVTLAFIKLMNRVFKKGSLVILEAVYGRGSKFIDLAIELNELIKKNQLSVTLSNDIGGDPCIGVQKEAKVKYALNGQVLEKTYLEGEIIKLPQ